VKNVINKKDRRLILFFGGGSFPLAGANSFSQLHLVTEAWFSALASIQSS
jgi:hypothetical protein